MKSEAAEQVAAPAESSNTQLAPGTNRPIKECGWKGGDRDSANGKSFAVALTESSLEQVCAPRLHDEVYVLSRRLSRVDFNIVLTEGVGL
jgi:hypothetical protein